MDTCGRFTSLRSPSTRSYCTPNDTASAVVDAPRCCPGAVWMFKTHLADAACLTEGADGAHVALVARAEGRRVEGGGVQRDTVLGSHVSGGLHVVALAERGRGAEGRMCDCTVQKLHMEHRWIIRRINGHGGVSHV